MAAVTIAEIVAAGAMAADCGVYLVRAGVQVMYVGHSGRSVYGRIRGHLRTKIPPFEHAWTVEVIPGNKDLEAELIRRYAPPYNVAHAVKLRRAAWKRSLEYHLDRAVEEAWDILNGRIRVPHRIQFGMTRTIAMPDLRRRPRKIPPAVDS